MRSIWRVQGLIAVVERGVPQAGQTRARTPRRRRAVEKAV